MMWAVVVPTAMSQAPPWPGLSGRPSESEVAPGTAMVVWVRALAWSGPFIEMNTEPNSGATRVPSASSASTSARSAAASCPEPPALGDAIEAAHAGALHREGLPPRLVGAVVADEPVRAFLEGLVGEVGVPLDDGGGVAGPDRRGREGAFDEIGVRLRLGAGGDGGDAEDEQDELLH